MITTKWKTLIGMAVASAFASSGALAGSFNHGTEVQTPISVNESAPWLALEESGFVANSGTLPEIGTMHEPVALADVEVGTGASATEGAMGTVGFDSSTTELSNENAEYWRIDQTSDVGSTQTFASGSGGFDSLSSSTPVSDDELAFEEVYIVPAPLASFDGTNYAWTIDTSDPDSIEHLTSITDYYVLTPIASDSVDIVMHDHFADASDFSSDVNVGSTASSASDSFGFDSEMSADASSFSSEPVTESSVTTYYGDNLALLLDSGFTSDEMST
jgi:hypothetical protein